MARLYDTTFCMYLNLHSAPVPQPLPYNAGGKEKEKEKKKLKEGKKIKKHTQKRNVTVLQLFYKVTKCSECMKEMDHNVSNTGDKISRFWE